MAASREKTVFRVARRTLFPELKEDQIRIKGKSRRTYHNLVSFGAMQGKRFVLKQKQKDAPVAHVSREAIILRLLNKHGFGPKFFGADYKRGILLRENIAGRTPRKATPSLICEIAGELSRIHSLRFEKPGRPFEKRTVKSLSEFFAQERQYLGSMLDSLQGVQNPTLLFLKRKFEALNAKYSNFFDSTSPVFSVINMDLLVGNMVRKKGRVYFFDWNTAKIGDPAMDIARLFVVNDFSNQQQRLFFREYLRHSPSVNLEERVNVYLPYLQLGRAIQMLTVLRSIKSEGVNPFPNKPKKEIERTLKVALAYLRSYA